MSSDKQYRLKNKFGKVLPIVIHESAKEDFKEMMFWSEAKFKRNTLERKNGKAN